MSSIGKIFTVLNLILAAAFLGWAANVLNLNAEFKSKWESEIAGRKADAAAAKAEVEKLGAANGALQNSNNTLTGARDTAKNAAERAEKDLENEKLANAQLRADVDGIKATLGTLEDDRKRLQADKDKAEKLQRDAEDAKHLAQNNENDATKKATDLEAALQSSKNDNAELEKEKTKLRGDLAGVQTELATLVDMTQVKVSDIQAVPLIPAAVLDVSMKVDPGLVALNKGSAEGVKRGFTFEIYDGQVYKGQVRVEFVHDHSCSAIITRKVDKQTIRQGDSAQTRI